MSFFGDVLSFENFKLGNMLDKYKEDPERIFLGINTPLESSLWGKVLNKDYSPTVDMWGGATDDDYSKAQGAGINTGPGASMHGIARTITGLFAGGAAAKGLGMGGSAGGGLTQSPAPVSDAAYTYPGGAESSPGLLQTSGPATTQQGGLLGAYQTAKPYVDAAKTGMDVSRMFQPQGAPSAPQPFNQYASGNQSFNGLLAQIQAENDRVAQENEARRQRRMSMIGGY